MTKRAGAIIGIGFALAFVAIGLLTWQIFELRAEIATSITAGDAMAVAEEPYVAPPDNLEDRLQRIERKIEGDAVDIGAREIAQRAQKTANEAQKEASEAYRKALEPCTIHGLC